MDKITEQIYNAISNQRSVFLVGQTNSGKTWYIENQLIPFLEKKELQIAYFQDSDHILDVFRKTTVIVDEVETLLEIIFEKSRISLTSSII